MMELNATVVPHLFTVDALNFQVRQTTADRQQPFHDWGLRPISEKFIPREL